MLQVTIFKLLKLQEEVGRAGRKDLGDSEQVGLEGSVIGKLV